ncbi:MAG TPA: GNAT family N-acetyltransferase [Solirubrobacterales bacterium]|nr:GNAT family N-acetyltransferase [Solirubrobacterales bacterium]
MTAKADDLRVTPLPDIEQLRGPWEELSRLGCNPFLSWEWASTWWRHFGREREQKILGCHDAAGKLVGIVPLYYDAKRPLRLLRFIGHFPADQLEPLCAPADLAAVIGSARRQLAAESCWDLLLTERLPGAADLGAELGTQPMRCEATPELRLETADWDEFLASKSSNFRGQIRNRQRRLERDHGLEFRLAEDPERLQADMDTLFKLHELRYGSAEKGLGAFSDELASFHRDFARLALENGWLRLWFAELDGEPAAAWYGFRLGGADWFYQSGRDPERDRQSVGFVLMAHTLRDAVESGMRTYKLLLGAEEYKKRFSNSEPTVETFAVTRTVRGRVALRAVLTQQSLTAKWRQRRGS